MLFFMPIVYVLFCVTGRRGRILQQNDDVKGKRAKRKVPGYA